MSPAILVALAGLVVGLVVTVSVVRLLHRVLDRRDAGGGEADLRAEVQALRDHVDALEERLDFAERLLAQRTGRVQVPPEA